MLRIREALGTALRQNSTKTHLVVCSSNSNWFGSHLLKPQKFPSCGENPVLQPIWSIPIRRWKSTSATENFPWSKVLETKKIKLYEPELEEIFARGSGKGGQKVNKTSNKVVLTHKPTGTQVHCHATRYLERNRKIARQLMISKLDEFVNKESSKKQQKIKRLQKKKQRKHSRSKQKAERIKLEKQDYLESDDTERDNADGEDVTFNDQQLN